MRNDAKPFLFMASGNGAAVAGHANCVESLVNIQSPSSRAFGVFECSGGRILNGIKELTT